MLTLYKIEISRRKKAIKYVSDPLSTEKLAQINNFKQSLIRNRKAKRRSLRTRGHGVSRTRTAEAVFDMPVASGSTTATAVANTYVPIVYTTYIDEILILSFAAYRQEVLGQRTLTSCWRPIS